MGSCTMANKVELSAIEGRIAFGPIDQRLEALQNILGMNRMLEEVVLR